MATLNLTQGLCTITRLQPRTQSPAILSPRCYGRRSIALKSTGKLSSASIEALKALKPQGSSSQSKPSSYSEMYTAASDYLKTIGFTNLAEIARVLDISTNPNSMLLGRAKNSNARPLNVENDMIPVVEFMRDRGMKVGEIYKIIVGHPPILNYTPEQLATFWDYFSSIGVTDVGAIVLKRPNLLGLDVDQNLKKIVGYLQYVETPTETIIKYLVTSI